MEIVDYKYDHGSLKYKIVTNESNGSNEKWVNAKDSIDPNLIQDFWEKKKDEQKNDFFPGKPTAILTQPTCFIKAKERNKVIYILTKFPTMDSPIYVPVYMLYSFCADMVNKFFEKELTDSTSTFNNLPENTVKKREKEPDQMAVPVVSEEYSQKLSVSKINSLKVEEASKAVINLHDIQKQEKQRNLEDHFINKNDSSDSSSSALPSSEDIEIIENTQVDDDSDKSKKEEEYEYEEEEEYEYEYGS